MSHDPESADSMSRDDVVEFLDGLPHWTAQAGLSPEGATHVADRLEALVETVQSAGYPPEPVDGPEPSSFPPPSNRIAAAANQLAGLVRGLGDDGWDATVGDRTITEHCRSAITELQETANA